MIDIHALYENASGALAISIITTFLISITLMIITPFYLLWEFLKNAFRVEIRKNGSYYFLADSSVLWWKVFFSSKLRGRSPHEENNYIKMRFVFFEYYVFITENDNNCILFTEKGLINPEDSKKIIAYLQKHLEINFERVCYDFEVSYDIFPIFRMAMPQISDTEDDNSSDSIYG